jgi:hypothetical protein
MIEPNNPHIDVDELMSRVRVEVLRRQFGGSGHDPPGVLDGKTALDALALEGHIQSAARLAEVRAKWSGRLSFFPFTLQPVQRFCLKLLAFVFRDQRHVNFEIVAALREALAINRGLYGRLLEVEEHLRRLERRD